MRYNFTQGLAKAGISMVLIGISMLLNLLPQEWMNLTVGGALVLVLNYFKVKYS